MSLILVRSIAALERSDDLHTARLLILMRACGGKTSRPVDGILKLANLDFLLRYPNCLARALDAVKKSRLVRGFEPQELDTIEAKMFRFRYEPWHSRYRRWIGLLVSRELVVTALRGRTVQIALTDRGREIADLLAQSEEFNAISRHAEATARAFAGESSVRLRSFLLATFPEIISLRSAETMSYEN